MFAVATSILSADLCTVTWGFIIFAQIDFARKHSDEEFITNIGPHDIAADHDRWG
jgi:hypothetical protein